MASDPAESGTSLREAALHFHEFPRPGKIEISTIKPLGNQRDLALAYSPGVAAPCEEIEKNPETASRYTSRANQVAVISNGTAVLGLGAIGALASKPVMEGKAVLFKKFAGIDAIDIEIDETDPRKFVEVVRPLEPTFGGINLEDIKAPECFEIEDALKKRMKIPVFHDDQHGTAIIVAAAVMNGLELAKKKLDKVKIVTSGAGAAAIACLNLLVALGADRKKIWVVDREGVVANLFQVAFEKSCRCQHAALRHRRRELGLGRRGAEELLEPRLHPARRQGREPNPLAARQDRRQERLRRGRREHEEPVLGRLFQGLQENVRHVGGDALGVRDDDDPDPSFDGARAHRF